MPNTLTLEPARSAERTDKLLPKLTQSNTDNADPHRA
jgi:hypothetical protein